MHDTFEIISRLLRGPLVKFVAIGIPLIELKIEATCIAFICVAQVENVAIWIPIQLWGDKRLSVKCHQPTSKLKSLL